MNLHLFGFGSDEAILQEIDSFDQYERLNSFDYINQKMRQTSTECDYFKISYDTFTLKVHNSSFIQHVSNWSEISQNEGTVDSQIP